MRETSRIVANTMYEMKKPILYLAASAYVALVGVSAYSFFTADTTEISFEQNHVSVVSQTVHTDVQLPPDEKLAIDHAKILETFRGKDVERVRTDKKLFALTFDGGADAKSAETILAVLQEHEISATFFLTGEFIEKFPGIADQITESGSEIANHTMTHKDLSKLSKEEVVREIEGMERAAEEKSISVAPFFRFPYGAPTKETIALANDLGYVAVRWTVDSLGWQGAKDGRDMAFVAQRVTEKAVPGGIALMHLGAAKDGTTFDADALPEIIAALKERGYRLVPLSELFREEI